MVISSTREACHGKLSLATIIEVYSHLVIGWLMGKEHDEHLVAVVLRHVSKGGNSA
jgi:hypothetical protein